MDGLTFISKLVEFLAWPAGLITTAFVLRKEIKGLLPSITKFEAGPLKFELARIEKKLEAVAETTNVVIDKIGISEGDAPSVAPPAASGPSAAPLPTDEPESAPAPASPEPPVELPPPPSPPQEPRVDEPIAPEEPAQWPGPRGRVSDSPTTRLIVLNALDHSEFAMRSLSGIAADTGIHAAAVRAILSALMSQGLVSETINSEGKVRYFLTSSGSQTLLLTRVNLPTTRPGRVGAA